MSLVPHADGTPRLLLVGPWDPDCGEYTFLAPPLGVWRLAGALEHAGFPTTVFDPNCVAGTPEAGLEKLLGEGRFDVLGFSTTGMTLRFDLALAHLARRVLPRSLLVAGGMEATFRPDTLLDLGPFDIIVLGEGERPLLELAARLRTGASLDAIPGTAQRGREGTLARSPQPALTATELRDAVFRTPYEKMPFRRYWERLEKAYSAGALPHKAHREAQLAEIRSVRLITLNYCPLGCTFCSSTNFLNAAQDGTARIARLDADDCLTMLRRIVSACPDVRTVIFQDDIFVFTSDQRLVPLCEGILAAKRSGDLPPGLQFISTNRIDAMTEPRLNLMRRAGFRWVLAGCEVGVYPYVIPFSGSAMAADPGLRSSTVYATRSVAGTPVRWEQGTKILPQDREAREAILAIEQAWHEMLPVVATAGVHLPSRVRSLLWTACAIPELERRGFAMPPLKDVVRALLRWLPSPNAAQEAALIQSLVKPREFKLPA